jgi:hypothetical protein
LDALEDSCRLTFLHDSHSSAQMPLDTILHGCTSDSGVPNFDCHGSREAPQRRFDYLQIIYRSLGLSNLHRSKHVAASLFLCCQVTSVYIFRSDARLTPCDGMSP